MSAHLNPLPPQYTTPGADARLFADEYLYAIRDAIVNSPRSLQRDIGPSEIGHVCIRRIGYRLLGQPERESPPNWKATIGTGTHLWLETAFDAYNVNHAHLLDGQERFYIETRVSVGEVNGTEITGSCDLYDRVTHTVVDHKGLALTTPIPTPAGWTTMGAIQIGETVFDAAGKQCTVTRKFPINNRDCYRITFDDKSSVVCDDIHEWNVIKGAKRVAVTLSTTQIIAQLREPWRDGQRQLRILNTRPLQCDLLPRVPVPPYTLGSWLGDGTSRNGHISKPDDDLFTRIEEDGFNVSDPLPSSDGMTRNVQGLVTLLRKADLLQNKHIPAEYLRASYGERLDLLRGLMDTDGSWNKQRNQAVFITIQKELAADVAELVASLGWRYSIARENAHGFGKSVVAHKVYFVPFNDNPFHLPRKANLVRVEGSSRCRERVIVSVEPVDSVPTQCIEVDSADHTYLCTRAMIPTHNCVGPTRLLDYRRHGPGEQYRTQAHLYGRGWQRAGLPVETVMIAFLPRNGELADAYIWHEPYDEQIAIDALERLAGIDLTVKALGYDALPHLATTNHFCSYCPYFKHQSDNLRNGCPGDPASNVNNVTTQFEGILEHTTQGAT